MAPWAWSNTRWLAAEIFESGPGLVIDLAADFRRVFVYPRGVGGAQSAGHQGGAKRRPGLHAYKKKGTVG